LNVSDKAAEYWSLAFCVVGCFVAVCSYLIVWCITDRPRAKPPCAVETEVDGDRVRREAPTPEELQRVCKLSDPKPKK
jgi:hypothetical protein